MKYIAKALIAMLICMAALIGPSVALNPAALIITECVQSGHLSPLSADVVPESVALSVPSVGDIYVEPDGSYAFFVNPELPEITKSTLTFTDVYGLGHSTSVTVYPCIIEVPTCEFVPLRDTRIEIYEPTELGQEIDISIRFPGNGEMSSRVFLDGVESDTRVWNGESCVVVEAIVNGVVYARNGISV